MKKNYFPNEIFGYFTWTTLYDDMVKRFPPSSTFVEVGVLEGQSLGYLITKVMEAGKDISLFAVDWFDGISKDSLDKFNSNMSLVQDKFTLIVGLSTESASKFQDQSVDFIFIDADHKYESVYRDIIAWLPKLKDGGVIAGHDYIPTYPGVIKVVNDIFKDNINKEYMHEGCWMVEKINNVKKKEVMLIDELLQKKSSYETFIQIGAYNGYDEFKETVLSYKPNKVILIEPNSSMIPQIEQSYKHISDVSIENVAITTDNGAVLLYIPKLNEQGVAENGSGYYPSNFSLLPMDDWGDNLTPMKADGMTFDTLIQKHNITHIDYLCIDTEGYDAEIIKSIDFDKVSIDIIKYEKWYFAETCFERYGDKSEQYGINGMDEVTRILKKNGYKLHDLDNDIIAEKYG